MEKILLALDRNVMNMNVVDFACYLAKLTRSELTVVFLQDGMLEPASGRNVEIAATTLSTQAALAEEQLVMKPVKDNIVLFESACQNRGVKMRVHENEGDPLSWIIAESRFADVLVVDPEMSFGNRREAVPTAFIKEVLTHSECPVVIAPYTFNGAEEIVFAYDGNASSIFAMKQFSYLFPELSDTKLTVLQVSGEQHKPLIEKKKLIEFLQMHYSAIGYRMLEGNAKEELFKYLHDKKNLFVVMGAYGRKNLASIFRQSTADLLLKTVNLPLFIAHKD
jgi:hypothetical protein